MNNIFSSFYSRLCKRRERVRAEKKTYKAYQQFIEYNPTCRIQPSGLKDVDVGEHVAILKGASLSKVIISNFSYVSNESVLINVEIGKFCSIGPRVQIGLGPHPSRVFVSTYPAFYTDNNTGCPMPFRDGKIFDDTTPKTVLANDIWIGANAIIPGGINIGTGAIVAAGSVVVKDVPPYAIVGGNPATIIRYRFPDDQIKMLLKSEWWDWPIDKIRQNVDIFSDVEKFQGIDKE